MAISLDGLSKGHLSNLATTSIDAINKTQGALAKALEKNPDGTKKDGTLEMTDLEDVMAYNTLNIVATSTISFSKKALDSEEKKLETINR